MYFTCINNWNIIYRIIYHILIEGIYEKNHTHLLISLGFNFGTFNASQQAQSYNSLKIAQSLLCFGAGTASAYGAYKLYNKAAKYERTYQTLEHIELSATSESSTLTHLTDNTIDKLQIAEYYKDAIKKNSRNINGFFDGNTARQNLKKICETTKPRVNETTDRLMLTSIGTASFSSLMFAVAFLSIFQ